MKYLDIVVKFSDFMDSNTVKGSVYISPQVETRLFFGRESELSDGDTLHIRLLRGGRHGLKFSESYEIVIAQSATNRDGVTLDDDYAFQFTTDGPLVVGSIPEGGGRDIPFFPNDRIIIDTNAPVNQRSIIDALKIRPNPQSNPIPFVSSRRAWRTN